MKNKVLQLAGPSILATITVPLGGMVDVAISGRLGDAASIGGIAIATMLFDLLYWNMGFLRVGTSGFTAQAYGRRDFNESIKILVQAIGAALATAMFIWLIQYAFLESAFYIVKCSPDVERLAREYFYIRIWAAPATLTLFAFKGWFIGMQNTISPMVVDITVNVLNIILSFSLALYTGLGFTGIALGTLIAQYVGIALSIILMYVYYRKLFHYINVKASLKIKEMKSFFVLNGNLFLRSSCLLLVYTGFTSISSKYGDTTLAVNTIMMKLMLLYSYFIDGFAYAGEALTGRYVGAKDVKSLKESIRTLFIWSFGIGLASTVAYAVAGEQLFRLMTNNESVINAASEFLPWLLIMPLVSCIAFTWDGIYIGATASTSIRNTMIASALSFFVFYYALESYFGVQALWIGYFAHLVVRTVMMSLRSNKEVIQRASI